MKTIEKADIKDLLNDTREIIKDVVKYCKL